ncbi:hypothetical protein Q8F55_007257 [Vanrija albida]|uniref:Glycosyltransferase family 71 protein n=1 Tax=Vanrija albida TaxID=181172 RepID=A0ABR3PZT5_9TREE
MPGYAGYIPLNAEGVRRTAASLRLRLRPLQVLILASVLSVILLPLIIGAERRAAVTDYLIHRPEQLIASHIPPPTGGVDEKEVPLTLEKRLDWFIARPVLEQWEAELPSRMQCPLYTYARNTYFFHTQDDRIEKWKEVSKATIVRQRTKVLEYFRKLDRDGEKLVWTPALEKNTPVDQRRGVIYTGGDSAKNLARLKLSLHMLRNVVNCTLPVEVHHYEKEMKDKAIRYELEHKYGVTLVQSKAQFTDGKPWQIKNRAFVDTKFTQFVYMDSDNLPLQDPEEHFDSVEFKQSGSVFWGDLNKDHPDNAIYRFLGRPCSDEHWPAESGQVVFDKSGNEGLNLAVLHLSNHMMDERDFYGSLSYGDKDTYRFSFYALGLNYQQAPRMFASAGGFQDRNGQDQKEFCGHTLMHWGLTPERHRFDQSYHPKPAFLHTILGKVRYGLNPEKVFSHFKRPREDYINDKRLVRTDYQYTGECFDITLKGPDGLPDTPNSYGDGQGTLIPEMSTALDPAIWAGLHGMAKEFVELNIPGT